ncbi:hypothetical protein LELG_02244 [Lodderomyces elongisporus NRRL YB-4239]|uniref:Uncharacterized protein n=1 Tax=Lodderomyces elongisporus (strain ATCC 11503 / CBS 2605 / JCM 1781 / NBRC 1676 / NRRL YB-4239) TaxID=379508 RepID=A5DY07_LODEL|nr:hypothetical protein LELG_02244 [Lodderomyces elongisporus NRRL YB-4239]
MIQTHIKRIAPRRIHSTVSIFTRYKSHATKDDQKTFSRRKNSNSNSNNNNNNNNNNTTNTPTNNNTSNSSKDASLSLPPSTSQQNESPIPYLPMSSLPPLPEHLKQEAKEGEDKEPNFKVELSTPKPFIDLVVPQFAVTQPNLKIMSLEKMGKVKDLSRNFSSFAENGGAMTNDAEDGQVDDLALIQLGKEIGAFMEPDYNEMYPSFKHPLKKSLSGMTALNKPLNSIHDSYLWEVVSPEKLWKAPYQGLQDPLGFKKWEQEFLAKEEKRKEEQQLELKEYREFQALMGNRNSFFETGVDGKKFSIGLEAGADAGVGASAGTSASAGADSSTSGVVGNEAGARADTTVSTRGRRRKLNRKLLKKFKKLKEDGKVPERNEIIIELK